MNDDKIKKRLEKIEERLDQLQVTAETILSRLEKTPVGSNARVYPHVEPMLMTTSPGKGLADQIVR